MKKLYKKIISLLFIVVFLNSCLGLNANKKVEINVSNQQEEVQKELPKKKSPKELKQIKISIEKIIKRSIKQIEKDENEKEKILHY